MSDSTPPQPDLTPEEPEFTVPQILHLLWEGEMEVKGLLPWSSNYTFLVEVRQEGVEAVAVYKPRRGERPLWDFPTGTLYRREVAAFVVSNALGWHLVPPTVKRQGEHGIGMVQLFIEHDPEEHFFTFREPWSDTLTQIALFDILINNADRKGGHCLRDPQGRIWAIDHGIAFHQEPKLRTVIWEPAGKPIPAPMLEDMKRLQQQLEAGEEPTEELSKLLRPPEMQAFKARLDTLIQSGHFPLPPEDRRHVPWPMV